MILGIPSFINITEGRAIRDQVHPYDIWLGLLCITTIPDAKKSLQSH